MVSKKNIQKKAEALKIIEENPVVGLIDMYKLPARQLLNIRNKLKGSARIVMFKKRVLTLAFKESKKKGLSGLIEHVRGEPALILTEINPFKLAKMISESKSKAAAKPGDIAPINIEVKAGPTSIAAGPAIADFQKLKIPTGVEGGKISVKQDMVIVKKGEAIVKNAADLMSKLGIEPMEIGLDLVAAWEKGDIYNKEVLFIPPEQYIENLKRAHVEALNLAVKLGYLTQETVKPLIAKAHREALALAVEAEIMTEESKDLILAKADAQAKEIKKHIKENNT